MIAMKRYAAVLLALVLTACAGQPEENAALEDARQAVNAAEQNPAVVEYAPLELQEAREALGTAIEAWKEGEDERTEHFAFVAQRNAQTAEAMARAAEARQAAQAAGKERQMVILESREREAQMAREEAQQQRQLAEQARQELQQMQQRLSELEPRQTERGLVLTLGSFLFNLDSAELKPEAQGSLDKLANFLRSNPEREVLIEGYTDATGPEDYNERLSRDRAEAVVRALTRRGIGPERLRAVGYGEAYPVASNDEPSGRAQNRRVELVISEEPPQTRGSAQARQAPLSDRLRG